MARTFAVLPLTVTLLASMVFVRETPPLFIDAVPGRVAVLVTAQGTASVRARYAQVEVLAPPGGADDLRRRLPAWPGAAWSVIPPLTTAIGSPGLHAVIDAPERRDPAYAALWIRIPEPGATLADFVARVARALPRNGARLWAVRYRIDCPRLDTAAFDRAESNASRDAQTAAAAAGLQIVEPLGTVEMPRGNGTPGSDQRICEDGLTIADLSFGDALLDATGPAHQTTVATGRAARAIAGAHIEPGPSVIGPEAETMTYATAGAHVRIDPEAVGPTVTVVGTAERADDVQGYRYEVADHASGVPIFDTGAAADGARRRLRALGILESAIVAQTNAAGFTKIVVSADRRFARDAVARALAGDDRLAHDAVTAAPVAAGCGTLDRALASRALASARTRADEFASAFDARSAHLLAFDVLPAAGTCDAPAYVLSRATTSPKTVAFVSATFALEGTPKFAAPRSARTETAPVLPGYRADAMPPVDLVANGDRTVVADGFGSAMVAPLRAEFTLRVSPDNAHKFAPVDPREISAAFSAFPRGTVLETPRVEFEPDQVSSSGARGVLATVSIRAPVDNATLDRLRAAIARGGRLGYPSASLELVPPDLAAAERDAVRRAQEAAYRDATALAGGAGHVGRLLAVVAPAPFVDTRATDDVFLRGNIARTVTLTQHVRMTFSRRP